MVGFKSLFLVLPALSIVHAAAIVPRNNDDHEQKYDQKEPEKQEEKKPVTEYKYETEYQTKTE